jgi:2-polyprenyl-3-methyl-5-hydroxy-6-metoxy-1,4-benzoquinol methylase
MNCRHCGTLLHRTFLDLGTAPPSNAYLTTNKLHAPESWFPLRLLVCENCLLVQTEDFSDAESFFTPDYAYFSSFSDTWLTHAEEYVHSMIDRFSLGSQSKVVEVAANDGYLLQFVQNEGIPCLGIEPTSSTAQAARKKGISIVEDFFGKPLASSLIKKGYAADLITANNVLAHVPDINDFISGFTMLLKPQGVATFEFPHLLQMVQKNQFDTVYHEHFSYLSFTSVQTILLKNGLQIFDVEQLPTHGGSLRIFAQRRDTGCHTCTDMVVKLLKMEQYEGITSRKFYTNFQQQAELVKNNLLSFLLECKRQHLKVAAYGAAAKGNTLLNYAGVKPDLVSYVVDKNPAKQGKFMPGSRIPILTEKYLKTNQPDRILILPWNIKEEIIQQLKYVQDWGGKFVSAIPDLKIWNG